MSVVSWIWPSTAHPICDKAPDHDKKVIGVFLKNAYLELLNGLNWKICLWYRMMIEMPR
jgi:hypothetical protein